MYALILAEHSNDDIDVLHVLTLCLVHDIVEIDAGDTFAYDASANTDKDERERRAAERLFGLLPADQAAFMGDDWPDLPAMRLAGLALAPADADPEVRERADWVASRPGGHGAVREFADWWLARCGLRDAQLQRWLDQADSPGALAPASGGDAAHASGPASHGGAASGGGRPAGTPG